MAHENARPPSILFVCTGNVCRSPLMERLLATKLDARLGAAQNSRQLVLSSAGTHALGGQPMTDQAAGELVRLGGDPTSFVARQLTTVLVDDADLVVTATRAHRAEVVTLSPRATRYTFTVVELARLLRDLESSPSAADVRSRVMGIAASAGARRGFIRPGAADADDIVDPYGRASTIYRQASDQIAPAVDALAAAIAP